METTVLSIRYLKKICIAVGVTILIALIVGGVIIGIKQHKPDAERKTELGNHVTMLRKARHDSYNEPYISQDSPTYMCSIKHPSKEAYECPYVGDSTRISTGRNGERYLNYRRETYSFVDIRTWLQQPKEKRDSRIKKIRCCLLSYVANLLNMCPGSEQYACYTEGTADSYTWAPRCGPPKIECTCYQTQIEVCVEDNLPWCNSHTNCEQCRYKTVTDDGVHLRCVCNIIRVVAPELSECSTLPVAAKRNAHRISRGSPNRACSIESSSLKEPHQCESENTRRNNYDKYIKYNNGEVYLQYRGKTYHHDDIKDLLNQLNDRTDSRRTIQFCCLLSYMGNLMNMCPGTEQYACYMEDTTENFTPQCEPPKVKLGCKCYPPRIPICGEDKLPWCHSQTNGTECRHVTVTDDGAHLRCICNTTQQKDPESISCSKLSDAADKNDVYKDYRRHS